MNGTSRDNPGWDVPLSLCPGQVQKSRDKLLLVSPKNKKQEKDVLEQEKDVLKQKRRSETG
jgi:hypothetical protein